MATATIDKFAITQGWRIRSWEVTDSPGPIPSDGFKRDSTLLITIPLTPVGNTPACNLTWKDEAGHDCSMKGLPFGDGKLHGKVPVFFDGTRHDLHTEILLEKDGRLHGFLSAPGFDGNTGTFAADANPPGPLE
jgi:hypothetical protein